MHSVLMHLPSLLPSNVILPPWLPFKLHWTSSQCVTPFPLLGFPVEGFHRHRNRNSSVCASVQPDNVIVEPATKVEFLTSISAPGQSKQLSLLGTGVREKTIAFIGVKVYAIGMYVGDGISASLSSWKGKTSKELSKDTTFFKNVVEAPVEKSLKIVLVRDVDGATFWGALNEALGPRIKFANAGPSAQEALIAFGNVFKNRNLKQGTSIYLTSVRPSTLQVAVAGVKTIPSKSEASIESDHLVSALFDVYLGENSVSPTLKTAVTSGLRTII